MRRQTNARMKMFRFMKIIWLLPFFLVVSCSGSSVVKDTPGEQSDVVKAEGKAKAVDTYRYILGPRDEVTVSVWRNDDLKRILQIDPSGNVQFPLVGELKASGLTISQLRETMTLRLSKYIVDPQVDVIVSNLKNLKVYVLGEVKTPGTFDWRSGMLAWEGISQAGGFTTDANQENILLVRSENGRAAIRALNLKSILKGENLAQDVCLENGDVVYVLPSVIADVQRFMTRLSQIISPIIQAESGIVLYPQARDILRGDEYNATIIVPPSN
jgi:polysaccharide biosynthesis/export protein